MDEKLNDMTVEKWTESLDHSEAATAFKDELVKKFGKTTMLSDVADAYRKHEITSFFDPSEFVIKFVKALKPFHNQQSVGGGGNGQVGQVGQGNNTRDVERRNVQLNTELETAKRQLRAVALIMGIDDADNNSSNSNDSDDGKQNNDETMHCLFEVGVKVIMAGENDGDKESVQQLNIADVIVDIIVDYVGKKGLWVLRMGLTDSKHSVLGLRYDGILQRESSFVLEQEIIESDHVINSSQIDAKLFEFEVTGVTLVILFEKMKKYANDRGLCGYLRVFEFDLKTGKCKFMVLLQASKKDWQSFANKFVRYKNYSKQSGISRKEFHQMPENKNIKQKVNLGFSMWFAKFCIFVDPEAMIAINEFLDSKHTPTQFMKGDKNAQNDGDEFIVDGFDVNIDVTMLASFPTIMKPVDIVDFVAKSSQASKTLAEKQAAIAKVVKK